MSEQIALFIDFENIAIWAEQEFFDFELSQLMEYLQSRGPVVIKRAYADWTRFKQYRDDLLNHSIDLIQLYSIRAAKNRGDIRLVIDAFETTMTRPQIGTYVIVSGDSDFGPLVSKLREYGRYVIGIGPRGISHQLLVRSCDEFIYLQTIMGEEPESVEELPQEREDARQLLKKALEAYGQRGELPVMASKVKQTMLSMDPTFNEAKLGYNQFRELLEGNSDIARLFFRDLQIYVAPADFNPPGEFSKGKKNQVKGAQEARESQEKVRQSPRSSVDSLSKHYQRVFQKTVATRRKTRRDILRDIYQELKDHPGEWTPDNLLNELQKRYESRGMKRQYSVLLKLWQEGFKQFAYQYLGPTSFNTPVKLAKDIQNPEDFIRRVESSFVYGIIRGGYATDLSEMATTLYNDKEETDAIQALIDDLLERGLVIRSGKGYRLPGESVIPFQDEESLAVLVQDVQKAHIADNLISDPDTAFGFAEKGKLARSHNFSAAAQHYLTACALQWNALEAQKPGAELEDLRWYLVSYASVKAGELSQSLHEYKNSRPYYLAFFSLVQEDNPLWDRVRGLINPMLYYYYLNIGRELNVTLEQCSTPAEIVIQIATHKDQRLRQMWEEFSQDLATVNPDLLQRFANQVRLTQSENPESTQVADQIEKMLAGK